MYLRGILSSEVYLYLNWKVSQNIALDLYWLKNIASNSNSHHTPHKTKFVTLLPSFSWPCGSFGKLLHFKGDLYTLFMNQNNWKNIKIIMWLIDFNWHTLRWAGQHDHTSIMLTLAVFGPSFTPIKSRLSQREVVPFLIIFTYR